jgi:hypothetical protein
MIAERMGVSKGTILAWHRRYLFPLYSRRVGPRTLWYTNEGLVQRWEHARCLEEYQLRYGPARDRGSGAPEVVADAAAPRPAPPRRSPPPRTGGGPPRHSASEVLEILYALSENVSRLDRVWNL